jgi:hypothetical protein
MPRRRVTHHFRLSHLRANRCRRDCRHREPSAIARPPVLEPVDWDLLGPAAVELGIDLDVDSHAPPSGAERIHSER